MRAKVNYHILTIFPQLFENFSQIGLLGRACKDRLLNISFSQLRDFAINTHGQIDDTPFGGGSGMILRVETAVSAIEAAKAKFSKAKVVLFSPRGRVFNQEVAKELITEQGEKHEGFILLCCRYEGVDERVAENFVDEHLCIGDYVLMGGEVAAMAFIEATARLLPNVLGNPESVEDESFNSGLLEYPQWTKPQEYRGFSVPSMLLSGHHAEIKKWREQRALADTINRRPELVIKDKNKKHCFKTKEIDAALIHHPVRDKTGRIVTSSITNLDLHDIARSAKTFGINKYYIVHPTKALRRLMHKICEHWSVGYGLTYNPNRTEALETVQVVPCLDDVIMDIEARTGSMPILVSTSAQASNSTISFDDLRSKFYETERAFLILFGTAWGLSEELLSRCEYQLAPIHGAGEYNHLSVRAAAAIVLDRLFGS